MFISVYLRIATSQLWNRIVCSERAASCAHVCFEVDVEGTRQTSEIIVFGRKIVCYDNRQSFDNYDMTV